MAEQKKEVMKHFNSWSATYEKQIWHRDEYFHKNLQKWALSSIISLKDQFVLELGVGPGIYHEKFLQENHKVIGLDNSRKMLMVALNNLKKKDYNLVNLILADAEFLPFKEKTFDIMNCIEVLRHLPQPYKTIWQVFKEMNRVIRKEGKIIVTLPNILFPLNLFSVIYYTLPRFFMRIFNKKIGFHYGQKRSFPHFPVLYNEPEDHMFNILFIKSLVNKTNLKTKLLRGIFFFPACPKILFPLFKKLDNVLGRSIFVPLAYSFFIELSRP